MARRKIPFEVGNYYHVFNRGVDKRKIFLDKGDLYYFFDAIIISNSVENIKNTDVKNKRKKEKESKINSEKIVEIIAYAILPNHFHFILKEITEGGISKFMKKLSGSYSLYFNKKYERIGTLFQGRFKSSLLAYENSLERTSAYVNLNYKHHKIDPEKFLVKTSLFEYLGKEMGDKICSEKEIEEIIKEAGGLEKYKKYLKMISKHFTIEHKKSIKDLNFLELEN